METLSNLNAYNPGFAGRLLLKEGSVPSLFGPASSSSESQPGSMIKNSCAHVLCSMQNTYLVVSVVFAPRSFEGLWITSISVWSQLSRNVSMNSECVLLLLGVMIQNRPIHLCTNYRDLSIHFCVGLPHIPWLFGLISFKDVFLVTQFFVCECVCVYVCVWGGGGQLSCRPQMNWILFNNIQYWSSVIIV